MTELSFARTFLQALDSRPHTLSSDHIADPRSYPAQSAYILPRHSSAPQKKRKRDAAENDGSNPTSTGGISITLKSMKASNPSVTLSSQPPATTSIFDLKSQYAAQTSIPVTAIKLLYAKKPVGDSKTVAEVIGAEGKDAVEFSVMVMGGAATGAAATPPLERVASPPVSVPEGKAEAPVAQGSSGEAELKTEEFWSDLKGFLLQRIRDEEQSDKLVNLWRTAYTKEGS